MRPASDQGEGLSIPGEVRLCPLLGLTQFRALAAAPYKIKAKETQLGQAQGKWARTLGSFLAKPQPSQESKSPGLPAGLPALRRAPTTYTCQLGGKGHCRSRGSAGTAALPGTAGKETGRARLSRSTPGSAHQRRAQGDIRKTHTYALTLTCTHTT